MVVSAKTKNPEAIIRWVDYLNAPEVTHEPTMGLEEEGCWTKLSNGKYEYNSHKAPAGSSWTEWLSNIGWNTSSPSFQSSKLVSENRVLENDTITRDALIRTQEYMKYAVKEVIPPVMMKPEISNELNTIQTELKTLVNNYFAKSVMEGVTDAEWNSFQENLKKANFKRCEELYQKVYESTKK
jgi:putative aldouronate transport system substrate-binding protein